MLATRGKASGFTLIELMIVVAIIGVLASIAFAGYGTHIVKSRRVAAEGCLLEASQYMERFYTTNLKYNVDRAGAAVALPATQCRTDLANFYTVQLGAAPGAVESTYLVEAVPKGQQLAKDGKCGTLSTDYKGTKFKSGTATSLSECW